MSTTLRDAVVGAMAREGKFVPNTHPSVTAAVREAERALPYTSLKLAVAFGVSKADVAVNNARLLRTVR